MPIFAESVDSLTLVQDSSASWARQGARMPAVAYCESPSVPADEFVRWFLDVSQPKAARRTIGPVARCATQPIAPVAFNLPDRKSLASTIERWTASEPKLAGWIEAGVPPTQALSRFGSSLIRANHIQKGLEVFHAVTALNPEDPLHWSNFGVALDLAGALNESAACLERSLIISRAQPDTWLQLGNVRKKLSDSTRAETAYKAALEFDANAPLAWQCLGLLKEEQSDFPAAIDCYTACIERGGGGAAIHSNVGKLCYRIGRFADAHQNFAKSLEQDPSNIRVRTNEQKLRFIRSMVERNDAQEAFTSLNQYLPGEFPISESDQRTIVETAFGVLAGFGYTSEALSVGHLSMSLWPNQPSLEYLMGALAGGKGPDRSPREYIVEHFDRFADQFDSQLVGALGYDIPKKLCDVVKKALGNASLGDVLDAGCGTGLCGPELRPIARKLTGVDLSSRMLEQAEKRGGYDELVCDDLLSFLGRSPRRFDLIVAADLVIYFGELSSLLTSAAYAMRPGGLLAFSTESFLGDTFRLLPSGRFAHPPHYVERAARPEFALVSCAPTTVRLEGTERVSGNLFIFRRL
jgi:predicted TPR repeat methyltransferase